MSYKELNKIPTPKDFGAVGDGVTDDTAAVQKWADQKEKRVLDKGIYLVSKPIVFIPGGDVVGEGGELLLLLSDNFKGHSLLVCKASEKVQQLFFGLTIDMNNVDTFVLSNEGGTTVTIDICVLKNSKRGFSVSCTQMRPPIGTII